jgi:hypothetical protein
VKAHILDLMDDGCIDFDEYQRKRIKIEEAKASDDECASTPPSSQTGSKKPKTPGQLCAEWIDLVPKVYVVWYAAERKKFMRVTCPNAANIKTNDKIAATMSNKVNRRTRILSSKPVQFTEEQRKQLV